MKKALLLLLLIVGCTSCERTLYLSDVTHLPDNDSLIVTMAVRCDQLPKGQVNYYILENKTGRLINGSITAPSIRGGSSDYSYHNLTIDLSGVQLNPVWYYKVNITLTNGVKLSRSFYGQEPLNNCFLQPVVGDCKGNYTTYYYDQDTQRCEEASVSGCGIRVYDEFNECRGYCGERACNDSNPCPEGVDCYKYEDYEQPICWEGNPCNRCFYGECILNDSIVTCLNP